MNDKFFRNHDRLCAVPHISQTDFEGSYYTVRVENLCYDDFVNWIPDQMLNRIFAQLSKGRGKVFFIRHASQVKEWNHNPTKFYFCKQKQNIRKMPFSEYEIQHEERKRTQMQRNAELRAMMDAVSKVSMPRQVGKSHIADALSYGSGIHKVWIDEAENLTKEKTMKSIKIEDVTLVNGRRTDDYNIGELLNLVESEKRYITKLEDLGFTSTGIDNLKKRHEKNVELLLNVIDKMVKENEDS